MKNRTLKTWEFALIIGFMLALTAGITAERAQQALSDKLLRLHVVAASDSDTDQALKLKVRDRVLETAGGALQNADSVREAMALLEAHLPEIERAAQQQVYDEGFSYPVAAYLTQEAFPSKTYEGFALPRGDYEALRIVIGEGAGRNWWCVVFPPLCDAASSGDVAAEALRAGMTPAQVRLIAQDEPEYVFKFKILELWDEWKRKISG
jgi:stage II sporulation protein R